MKKNSAENSKEEKSKKKIVEAKQGFVVKSNNLVSSKHYTTLTENKIISLALSRIYDQIQKGDESLKAKLYPTELLGYVSSQKHIYTRLKKLADKLLSHTLFLEDGMGNFRAINLIAEARYENSEFSLEFTPAMKEFLIVDERYTKYSLSYLLSFSSNSSFRIYELLRSQIFRMEAPTDILVVEYGVNELKFMIGLVDTDDKEVQELIVNNRENVDWDDIYEGLPKEKRKYDEWFELKRNILVKAKEELEAKSDIKFEFEPIKYKRRVVKIRFYVERNNPTQANRREIQLLESYNKEKTKTNRQLAFPRDVPQYEYLYKRYVGVDSIGPVEIDLFLKDANGDEKKVEAAIEAEINSNNIDDPIGWIRSAIKNNYTFSSKKKKTTNEFNDFPQREYDFDELEKTLLKASYREVKENNDVVIEKPQQQTIEVVIEEPQQQTIDVVIEEPQQQTIEEKFEAIKKEKAWKIYLKQLEKTKITEDKLFLLFTVDEIVSMYEEWKKDFNE